MIGLGGRFGGVLALFCAVGCTSQMGRDRQTQAPAPRPGATTPTPMTGPMSAPMTGPTKGTADGAPAEEPPPTNGAAKGPAALPTLSPKETQAYLSFLAPTLVSRSLSVDEQKEIAASRQAAIPKILAAWTKDHGLALAARAFVEDRLSVGGEKAEIDFGLPGALAEHVVRKALPWSTIITSETCGEKNGVAVPCDSGAPYAAGVLTTRAYLVGNASRFNLTRARIMMKTFACRVYPMEPGLQPPLPKNDLIPMFRADNPDEQTDDRAVNGFGNGFGCYACHSQFGAHAQLFVKFDATGLWKSDATGLQDPKGELGRSLRGLMASHFQAPEAARSEGTTMLGQKVGNLREAALLLAKSPVFTACAVERILRFGGDLADAVDLDPDAVGAIASRARTNGRDPSFGDLVEATFTDPWVVKSIVSGIAAGGAP